IVKRTTTDVDVAVEPVLDPARIVALQGLVRRVPVADHVVQYAVDLVRATRPNDPSAPGFVREYVGWGAGPRASQYLILAGKARALLEGRFTVSREDVRALARPVLMHRVLTNFHAEAARVQSVEVIDRLLEQMPVR
ncbi:MAG: AAA family ATPase, partial [Myxococcales bacterium]|nr:AAA family ATPase [Myxococcales bacterium]